MKELLNPVCIRGCLIVVKDLFFEFKLYINFRFNISSYSKRMDII